MGSVGFSPKSLVVHEPFHADSEKEAEGFVQELVADRLQTLSLDERYISDHDRVEAYGMRMLLRSL
ncbi:hypothetical protein ACFONG_09375 [Uliginosibacterium paludis]|uniref:Uncharacterized protein n=1 Tax=Uliginosibacterium paludis TaxID=1615952 RepID=A0ABV2CW39_9RHOO